MNTIMMYNAVTDKWKMPTELEDGPYRFIFFSSNKGEPAHIHVKRERLIAKFGSILLSWQKTEAFQVMS
jgi:hypothetical protein